MKRIICILLVLILLFSGCGITGDNEYIAVEPHYENYEVAIDSKALTVSSYLSLKNAILNLVKDGVEEGVIRAESYSADLTEDLSRVVYEVSRADPLGAFAVDYMTYDYSKIVGYYEIHIHTTFRRSVEEIESICYVNSFDGLREQVRGAMETYEPVVLIQLGDYQELDARELVDDIFLRENDIGLENPEVSMETYPDSGSQRILELTFTYRNSQESLQKKQEEAREALEQMIWIYGSSNAEETRARRLYNRLCRDGTLTTDADLPAQCADSIYGALIANCATPLGYARTYQAMLLGCDIPCELVWGRYQEQDWVWCRVELDGMVYYADPAGTIYGDSAESFLIAPPELSEQGYEITGG